MARTRGSKNKKQPAKKDYKVTFEKATNEGENVASSWTFPIHEPDNEVEELTLICKVINSWDLEQKERNMRFLASKYRKFI